MNTPNPDMPNSSEEQESAPLRMEDIRPTMSGEDKRRALDQILRVLRGEAADGEAE